MNLIKTLLLSAGILVPGEVTPEARGEITIVTLAIFSAPYDPNGFSLHGGLVLGDDGNFYGTASSGGLYHGGTVYRMNHDGGLTCLYSFAYANCPAGTLAHAADGNFYGTTSGGGDKGLGFVFRITPEGAMNSLASLENPSSGGLIQGADGNLYGTTEWGGTNNGGSVFRISTGGTFATMASLGNAAHPRAALMQAADGNFYGTTARGGDYGLGTIFQMTPAGALTTVASFNGTNGSYPESSLIQAADGNFYGTASEGGTYSQGTAYRLTLQGLTGTITPLVSFDGTNGAQPWYKLIQATDGYFYGTAKYGLWGGTIFRLATNGILTTLSSHVLPCSELTQDTNGDFYGTSGDTIFVFNPNWPVILTQPRSGTYAGGTTATFTILAEGPGPLSYQWQKNGTNLNDGGNISGATTTNLAISSISASDTGTYTAIVSNAFGAVSSAGATLTLAIAPVITTPPASQTNFYGWTSSFTVSANGLPSPAYQWQRNGTNLEDNSYISGSRSATLTLRAVTYADAAIYSVVVSNVAGTVTSPDVTLEVTNELVQNGSFESGNFDGWSLTGSTYGSGVTLNTSQSGLCSAWLLGNGHLSQTIPTTPGTSYILSFWFWTVDLHLTNEFLVAWIDPALATTNIIFDQVNHARSPWTNQRFVVNATGTSTILDFGFYGSLGNYSLDDIVLLPVVPADSPPPQLTNVKFSPDDGTQFQIHVNAGNSYRLQVSSNLVDWVTLTNFLPFSDSIQIYDPQASNLPARFYRAISP